MTMPKPDSAPLRRSAVLLLALSAPAAQAFSLNLDFNSLPSAQGWTYMAMGNTAPETSVFSVSGGTLYQNSQGVGSAPQGSNRYNAFNLLTPGADYTLEFRAQVTGEESAAPNNHWGFGAGFFDGTGAAFGIALGSMTVQTDWAILSFDTSTAHTYRLVSHARALSSAAHAELWIDGQFISGGNVGDYGSCTPLGNLCNSVYLGDGTGGPNASGAYSSFSLASSDVPEPASLGLISLGLGLAGWRRRRHVQERSTSNISVC